MQTIAVLEGDETGQELLEEALRVLAPDVVSGELGTRANTDVVILRTKTKLEVWASL